LTINVMAAAVIAILAFLVFDGFLVNQLGELSWHGNQDAWRLLTFVAAAGLGLGLGVTYRAVRRWRVWAQWSRGIVAHGPDRTLSRDEQPSRNKAIVWNKKESRRG